MGFLKAIGAIWIPFNPAVSSFLLKDTRAIVHSGDVMSIDIIWTRSKVVSDATNRSAACWAISPWTDKMPPPSVTDYTGLLITGPVHTASATISGLSRWSDSKCWGCGDDGESRTWECCFEVHWSDGLCRDLSRRWTHHLSNQWLRWWPTSSGAVILLTGEWSQYNVLNNGSSDLVQQFSWPMYWDSRHLPLCLSLVLSAEGGCAADLGEMNINLGYQGGFLRARWPNWVGTNQWNNHPIFLILVDSYMKYALLNIFMLIRLIHFVK